MLSTTAFSAGREWNGNINGLFAFTDLNGAWDFSTGEGTDRALDLDVSGPWQFGIQVDLNRTSRVGDHWPVNLFLGIYYYGDSASDSFTTITNGTPNDTLEINGVDVTLDILELDVGFRKYLGRDEDELLPFFGFGGAVLLVDFTRDNETNTFTAPSGTNLYQLTDVTLVSESEQETFFGGWASLGFLFRPWDWLNVGAEARYLYTRTGFPTKDRIASWNLGLMVGYHF